MAGRSPRSKMARWLDRVGVPLKTVWFLAQGRWIDEEHVDDRDTFLETITMTFDRLKLSYALWVTPEGWCLLSYRTGECRIYPSREAAEMVAFHNG